MEGVVVLGVLFALLLGTGAGRESKARYGFGFWGVVVFGIASFFVMSAVHAILFVVGLVVLAVITWWVNLVFVIQRGMKRHHKE